MKNGVYVGAILYLLILGGDSFEVEPEVQHLSKGAEPVHEKIR